MSKVDFVFQEAVKESCRLQKKEEEEFYRNLREGDLYCHSRLRYSLARELISFFMNYLPGSLALYVYGSTISDTANLYSDLDLLVLVEEKGPHLFAVVQRIDFHLSKAYNSFLDVEGLNLTSILNVTFIDFQDLIRREGKAALIDSPYQPALRLYPEYGREISFGLN